MLQRGRLRVLSGIYVEGFFLVSWFWSFFSCGNLVNNGEKRVKGGRERTRRKKR